MVMLKLTNSLLNQSVVSLRTGGVVARIDSAIINPDNLKIEGFYCLDSRSRERLILLVQDIRDIVPSGIVVDDHNVLSDASELVRLKQVLNLDFELVGKPVQTVKKQKLGKVNDYAVDDQSFYVQKLYVERSLLKSLSSGQLSIDRTEIVEVTDRRVIIKELRKPAKSGVPMTSPAI
jgi:sporulation protein YlmC with PRC-barrel domain